MLLRYSLAALVVIGSVMAAQPTAAQRVAEQQRAAPASNPRDGLRVTQPGATLQRATTSISCDNGNGTITTFTLSVRGGECNMYDVDDHGGTGSGGTSGQAGCIGTNGADFATASCTQGCMKTIGQGSCTQSTT